MQAPNLCVGRVVLYRQVRRRRVVGWAGKFPAGALAIGGFG
jgi:hypothetical protein